MQVTALNTSAGRRKFFTLPGLSVLAEIVLILKFYSAAEVQKYMLSGDVTVTATCISFWFDKKIFKSTSSLPKCVIFEIVVTG